MTKQRQITRIMTLALLIMPATALAQRDIQERRQEARQEARIDHRTEARIDDRHNHTSPNNVIVIQQAMLRTVSYNGIVLLQDTANQRFYRADANGYRLYNVPYGAYVVELSPANPINITVLN
ncbi:hypothetical protein L4C36_18915 [Photobacterium japonica]|uniref:hypothetical protein n=1 Tax=Photobacterium japonica TaxID=2910235 RepID=UPI003D0C9C19